VAQCATIVKFLSTPLEKILQMALGMPEMIKEGQAAYVARYIAGTVIVSLAIAMA
jgi:hypothetical protein